MTPPPRASSTRILVAGVGLITPLGHGAFATFSKLLAGQTLADRAAALSPDTPPVALVQALGGVSVARHATDDPAAVLSDWAAREAAQEAGVSLTGLPAFIGSSKGAIAKADGETAQAAGLRNPLRWTLGPHGYLTHRVQQRLGVRVMGHAVGACASSLVALDHARRWLLHGAHDPLYPSEALVLTAEAALSPLFIHSYRRLGVLAPLTPTGYRQRPFDERRQGFMLSELGAAILLRRVDHRPEPGETELLDSGVASEAFDLIRPSPTMDSLAALANRLLAGRDVDVLHPHAPGTADHDPVELAVLAETASAAVPGSRQVDLYACKGALGHGLGAAGLVALVLAHLCLKTGRRPPMPWLEHPMDAPVPLRAAGQVCSRTGTHACFAAGFGGTTAGAVIQRH